MSQLALPFDAQLTPRYTKALDNIKQLKKQGAQDLKVENERLTHLKKDKNRAEAVSKAMRLTT